LASWSQRATTLGKTQVSPSPFHYRSATPEEHALPVSPSTRSSLFREVNDRIYELLVSAEPDLPGEFLCECGSDCDQRVRLLPAAFATLRENDRIVRSPHCPEPELGLRAVAALS
jgi:hypothetical protein